MYGCSGADVCEALWSFPCTIQCYFDHQLIGGKQLNYFVLMVFLFVQYLLFNSIGTVWLKINGKI